MCGHIKCLELINSVSCLHTHHVMICEGYQESCKSELIEEVQLSTSGMSKKKRSDLHE